MNTSKNDQDKKDENFDVEEAEIFPEQYSEHESFVEESENDNLASLQLENQKLKDEYLRALADAENTKKRCAQEIDKNTKYAISSFAKNLLSVADNLHRAIDAVGDKTKEHSQEMTALLQGVELTESELMKVFAKNGISKMETLDTVFNPNYHQVIQEVEDKDKPNGTVIAELQSGYMINDRILREAMVVVTKGGQ